MVVLDVIEGRCKVQQGTCDCLANPQLLFTAPQLAPTPHVPRHTSTYRPMVRLAFGDGTVPNASLEHNSQCFATGDGVIARLGFPKWNCRAHLSSQPSTTRSMRPRCRYTGPKRQDVSNTNTPTITRPSGQGRYSYRRRLRRGGNR